MRTRIPSTLLVFALSALAPMAALADACSDYEQQLNEEQGEYLDMQGLVLVPPDGNVATIQRCDIDGDNMVDINDIRAISMSRNQPAAHPDDPMDWDRNSVINVLDARGCQRACSFPRCAVQAAEPEELMGGETAPAECFQEVDLDGDGVEDFVAVVENLEEERAEGYSLEVVILNEDADGNIQHVIYPYTGQSASETGGEISQHLSMQPAGVVDLNPGTLTLVEPAVVSYRNGEPHVIYYFVGGVLNRAFYGIDD